jgi:tetratricopeptide (TPR) repeat protein
MRAWLLAGLAVLAVAVPTRAVADLPEAGAAYNAGRDTSGRDQWDQALGQLQRRIGAGLQGLDLLRPIPDTDRLQASYYFSLGQVYRALGQQALDILRGLEGTEGEQAGCLGNLAAQCSDLGQYERSAGALRRALTVSRRLPGTMHDQATCLADLGTDCCSLGRYGEALGALAEAERRR